MNRSPRFTAARNIAMKIPPHEFRTTGMPDAKGVRLGLVKFLYK
jgi:hypothetical protein